MIYKLIQGMLITALVIIVPILGNPEMLQTPHLWVALVFGVLASVCQPGYNPFTITARPGDRGTGAQIIWSVYVTQCAALIEAACLRYPRSVEWDTTAAVALACMTLGLALRTWAVFTLGDLFTMYITIQKDHSIVRTGPFRIVRHPSYLGACFMYLATTVFFHAWFSAVAAMVVLPFAFVRRIHYEEEMLKEEFGADYISYSSEVRGFLPWVW